MSEPTDPEVIIPQFMQMLERLVEAVEENNKIALRLVEMRQNEMEHRKVEHDRFMQRQAEESEISQKSFQMRKLEHLAVMAAAQKRSSDAT